MTEEEQVIRDWLAGQLSESGGPLPPARRRSQPLPRRQVVAVIATLIEEIDGLRAAPRAATEPPPGFTVERWIDSLHENHNGLVWITKAELRAALHGAEAAPSSLEETL